MSLNLNMPEYFIAFTIGIFGSMHCLGMCGGITNILFKKNKTSYKYLYNFFRIISYVLITIMLHLFGFFIFENNNILKIIIKIFSNIILITIVLQATNIKTPFLNIEKILYQNINIIIVIINKVKFKNNNLNAIITGLTWGLIPCGLIYSVIVWSIGYESIFKSILIITFFGLGTLPSMLFTPIILNKIKFLLNIKIIKYVFFLFVFLFSCKNIIESFTIQCH